MPTEFQHLPISNKAHSFTLYIEINLISLFFHYCPNENPTNPGFYVITKIKPWKAGPQNSWYSDCRKCMVVAWWPCLGHLQMVVAAIKIKIEYYDLFAC